MSETPTASVHQNSVMMNPLIRKLSRIEESAEYSATYGGIAVKTMIFMLAAAAGVVLYFLLHSTMAGSSTIEVSGYTFYQTEAVVCLAALLLSALAPLIAFAIRPLIPLFGMLYCASVGFSITMLATVLGAEYTNLIYLALGLTVILVAVMAFLYASRMIKVGKRFRAVVLTLFLTSIFSGVILFLLSLIPGVGPALSFLRESPVFSIGLSVVYIVIACAFLLVDFDTIERSVENKLPKKYEWTAAFGLAYTIIYLFLKILNLLCKLTQKNNSN